MGRLEFVAIDSSSEKKRNLNSNTSFHQKEHKKGSVERKLQDLKEDLLKDYEVSFNLKLDYNSKDKFVVESKDSKNPFLNSQIISLGNYMRHLRIQEYKIFQNDSYESSFTTYVNLTEYGMQINREYFSYLDRSFLNYNCLNFENGDRICECEGNNFDGMPMIAMQANDFNYKLQPFNYLLYPIILQETRQTRCILSLHNMKTEDKVVQPNDYVLGQSFFTVYNPMFVIDFSDELNPSYSLYIQQGINEFSTHYTLLISMCIVSAFALLLVWCFNRNKRKRLLIQYKKWRDIKELQDDYEVYVSDEYHYHISDVKMQIEQLQNLEKLTSGSGMHLSQESSRRSGGAVLMSSTNFDGRNTGYFSRKSIQSMNHTHAPQLNQIGSINRLDNLAGGNDSEGSEDITEEELKNQSQAEDRKLKIQRAIGNKQKNDPYQKQSRAHLYSYDEQEGQDEALRESLLRKISRRLSPQKGTIIKRNSQNQAQAYRRVTNRRLSNLRDN